jgi:hypothetical protein
VPAKLTPRAFRLLDGCTKTCSLSAFQLGPKVAELVHSWYEAGCNNATIVERAENIGVKVSEGAAGRHRANHLEPLDEFEDPTAGDDPKPKVDDLALLDEVISRGAESLRFKTSRVTTEQLLKAMEMKYRLTQGSVWEATLAALGAAMSDESEAPDAPEAERSDDERLQALVE